MTVLSQERLPSDPDAPPEVASFVSGPLVRRTVWLGALGGTPLVHAVSWWNEAVFASSMPAEAAPIGDNLAAKRTELFRQHCAVSLVEEEVNGFGLSDDDAAASGGGLEAAFGFRGPFWARHYVLWSGGKPLTVIREIFSPRLASCL